MFECADAGYVNSCVRTVYRELDVKVKVPADAFEVRVAATEFVGNDCFPNSLFACILSTEK
jgi:hypothetical protein